MKGQKARVAAARLPPISWGAQPGKVDGGPTAGSVPPGGGRRWARSWATAEVPAALTQEAREPSQWDAI